MRRLSGRTGNLVDGFTPLLAWPINTWGKRAQRLRLKHCLLRGKNVVVTFNYIHIFWLPNVPRNPTSYKAALPLAPFVSCALSFMGVSRSDLANCAKCTKMLNTCQLPGAESAKVPKWGLKVKACHAPLQTQSQPQPQPQRRPRRPTHGCQAQA